MKESFLTRRSTYTLLIIGFIVSALFFTLGLVKQRQEIRPKAAPSETVLSLVPSKTSMQVGEEVDVNVMIDTGTDEAVAADVTVTFDPNVFTGVSMTQGSFFSGAFEAGSVSGGQAHIIVGSSPDEARVGSGVVAALRLRATNSSAQSEIGFGATTAVSKKGAHGNVVKSYETTTIEVRSVAIITPDTKIYINPTSLTVTAGTTFTLPVLVDSGSNDLVGVDVLVNYDNTKLEGLSVGLGGFLPTTLQTPTISGGTARVIMASEPDSVKKGTGTLFFMEFKARSGASGIAAVSIEAATSASVRGSRVDVVKSRQGSSVSITSLTATPSPTPTSTPGTGGSCTQGIPAVPALISATAVSSDQIRISWNSASNATKYGIVYGTKTGIYLYGAADVGNTTSYTVGGLAAGTRYYFAIYAGNNCATSGYSNEVSTQTQSRTYTGVGTTYATPTPRATPFSSPVASFTPINPNSSPGPELFATPTPLPSVTLTRPQGQASDSPEAGIEGESVGSIFSSILRDVLFVVGAIVLALILIIIFRRRRKREPTWVQEMRKTEGQKPPKPV